MLGAAYSEDEIRRELDAILPAVNKGRKTPIPREVVQAVMMAENMGPDGNVKFRNAKSPANAQGVMQVLPATIKGLKGKGYLPKEFPEDLTAAGLREQLMAGVSAIGELIDTRNTTDPFAIGAFYNAGSKHGRNYMATGDTSSLPAETKGYFGKLKTAFSKMGVSVPDPTVPVPATPTSVQPDPSFRNSPLEAATNAANMFTSMLPQVEAAIFGANRTLQASGEQQRAAILAGAEAAGQQAKMQAEITIAGQETHEKIMQALGLDVTDPDSAISQELTRGAQARQQREQTAKQIAELQSKSLFTDPLGYIMAIPQLQQLVPQHNNLVAVENSAFEAADKLQARGLHAQQLIPAKTSALIRSKAQADAAAGLAKAQEMLAVSQANNAAGNAKALMDAMQARGNVFSVYMQLEGREESLALRRDAAEQKKAAAEQETAFLTGLNTYRRMISGNVKDYTAADLKTMPTELRAAWQEIVLRGNFGNSFSESIPFIERFGDSAAAANSGNAPMVQFARDLRLRAQQMIPEVTQEARKADPLAKALTEPQAYARALDKLFLQSQAYATKGADKSLMAATNSPYAIDYDTAAASVTPQNATSVIGQVLLRQRERNPYTPLKQAGLTDRVILNEVAALVKAGSADPAKAAQEVASWYKQMAEEQYTSLGLRYFGLQPLQDFTVTPGATGSRKVDLFNPTQIENYLTAEVASERRRKQFQAAGGRGNFLQVQRIRNEGNNQ